jgi:hypothetical protein
LGDVFIGEADSFPAVEVVVEAEIQVEGQVIAHC